MYTKIKKYSGLFVMLLCFNYGMTSCGGDSTENNLEAELLQPDEETTQISEEEIFNLIETFPTPIEMAMVLQASDYELSSETLLPPDSADRFMTSYEKGMAMGAYGADMGYLNMYSKIFAVPDYLAMVRNLSKELDLDSFFDFESMMDMADNTDNIDSMIQMSTESFNEMEAHLREKGRDEISLLIVFGTWLEGAFIIAHAAENTGDASLRDRVAEQKEFVVELARIFEGSSDEYFKQLSGNMKALNDLYAKVEIEIIQNEPTEMEVDGMLVFVDNSETIIHADASLLDEIIAETKSLRNKLLN